MSIEKNSYEHSMNIKMCLIFLKYARTFYTSYKKKKGDDHCGSCVWAVNRSSRVVWAKPNRIWAFRRRSVIFGFVRFGGKSETEPNPVRDESIEGVLYMLRDRQTAAAPIGHRLSLRTPAIRIQVSFPFLVAYPVL